MTVVTDAEMRGPYQATQGLSPVTKDKQEQNSKGQLSDSRLRAHSWEINDERREEEA